MLTFARYAGVQRSQGEIDMTRLSVLVVDDEADILELVKYNLGKNGYDVACAASGSD